MFEGRAVGAGAASDSRARLLTCLPSSPSCLFLLPGRMLRPCGRDTCTPSMLCYVQVIMAAPGHARASPAKLVAASTLGCRSSIQCCRQGCDDAPDHGSVAAHIRRALGGEACHAFHPRWWHAPRRLCRDLLPTGRLAHMRCAALPCTIVSRALRGEHVLGPFAVYKLSAGRQATDY